jgi:hypothetical protein
MFVMAGLDPAIHVLGRPKKDVDARHKAGHDEQALIDLEDFAQAFLRTTMR